MSSEKRVEVFLSMMAGGGFYRQIGHIFGLAKSTVIAHTREVSDFNFSIANQSIFLPVQEEFESIQSNLVLENGEAKKVILYIDGSII